MSPNEPNPMEIFRAISPEGARTYMEHRAATMDNPQLQALPVGVKLAATVAR